MPIRLVLKDTLLLLLLYALACALLIWGVRQALDQSARTLMESTAQLVGQEVVSAVSDQFLDQLLTHRDGSEGDVLRRVRELIRNSAVIKAVALVGSTGEVVAGDAPRVPGLVLPTPQQLFGSDTRPRLVSQQDVPFRHGSYVLEVPLLRRGTPEAYLRLILDTSQISELYQDIRGRLFFAGALGLLVIGALSFLLHAQLRRREETLAHSLENVLEGQDVEVSSRETGEFSRAFVAAGRLRYELMRQRQRETMTQLHLSRISHLLDVGVLIINPSGVIEFASHRARELLGITSEALDDARWKELLEQLTGTLERGRREISGSLETEAELLHPERRLNLQLVIHRLDDEDCPGFLILVRDRQLVRSLETDLRLAAQLRGLTRLYLGVTHDLKAPLNAMVLNLELLKQSLAGGFAAERLAERQATWVGVLEQELARLKRSLEMLLNQTAPSTTNGESVHFDLRDVIAEVEALLAPQARQQRVELQVQVAPERLPVWTSRDQVKQALLNIAINGLEALLEGGRLEITAERQEHRVVVRIVDNGAGVPRDLWERIFEMHFTTKKTGTGIGLYVTRSILESQGGTVELVSSDELGTTFEVQLPADEEEGSHGARPGG